MPLHRLDKFYRIANFFKNNYYAAIKVSYILIFMIYALIAIIAYRHITRPTPPYFVTTTDGKLIEIKPE